MSKFGYENLEIWQLAMKLVKLTYSYKNRFPQEEKYKLWSQLTRAVESVPQNIAEGYGRSSRFDFAHFIDQSIASTLESDTSYKIAVQKDYLTSDEYENLVSPLIKEVFYKQRGFKNWVLKNAGKHHHNYHKSRRNVGTQPQLPQVPTERRDATTTTTSKGFTLIEILVTVAILGIISTAAISIFSSMTAAYNKSSIINELREEGSRVMGEIERLVQASENAQSGGSSVLILTLNTGSLEYQQNGQCKTVTLSLGSATVDKNNYINKSLTDCEGTASGAGEMTNTNRTSGVNVAAFTPFVHVVGTSPKVVKIYLTLEQGLSAAARQDYQASVNLETTVSTRSY